MLIQVRNTREAVCLPKLNIDLSLGPYINRTLICYIGIFLLAFGSLVTASQAQTYVDINAKTANPYGQCGGSLVLVTFDAGTYAITPIDRSGVGGYQADHYRNTSPSYTYAYVYTINSVNHSRSNSSPSTTSADAFSAAASSHASTPENFTLTQSTQIGFWFDDSPNCGNCNGGSCTCDANGSCYSDNSGGVSLAIATVTPTPAPTSTPTATPTATFTPTATPTSTPTPTPTPECSFYQLGQGITVCL